MTPVAAHDIRFLSDHHAAALASRVGPDWLDTVRRDAWQAVQTAGLPGPRTEAWKFTSVKDLIATAFRPASAIPSAISVDSVPAGALDVDAATAVLVNGRLRSDLSDLGGLGAGISVEPLMDRLASDGGRRERLRALAPTLGPLPFAALNTACLQDGLAVTAAAGAAASRTVHIVNLIAGDGAPIAVHPHLSIVAAPGSRMTVAVSHVSLGDGQMLANTVTDIDVQAGAALAFGVLQQQSAGASHMAMTLLRLAERATVDMALVQLGAALAREEIRVALEGAESRFDLHAGYAVDGSRHTDTTTLVEHTVPDTASGQVVKGVLDDRGHGVFQGKIHVARDAQRTDGKQLHKGLLLSEKAAVDCKPELEIFADDVQCAHGATAGDLEPDQMFYLQARGLEADAARRLLVAAFLTDVVQGIGDPALRAAFRRRVASALGGSTEDDSADVDAAA